MSGTPTTRTTIVSTAKAAAAPSRADRQPRVTPDATTIVRASTISTVLAPNTANSRTTVDDVLTGDSPFAQRCSCLHLQIHSFHFGQCLHRARPQNIFGRLGEGHATRRLDP